MVMDGTNQLMEIGYCQDCFRHSSESKLIDDWFARPCHYVEHQLVFAKQAGFSSYWPAKVIRLVGNDQCDIRYFGGKHKRAIVDIKSCQQVITNMATPTDESSRLTPQYQNALAELQKYFDMQKQPSERFTYQNERSKYAKNWPTPAKRPRSSSASASSEPQVCFFDNMFWCIRLSNEN